MRRGVGVLLANPRWERQYVKLTVEKVIADGTNQDGASPARIDRVGGEGDGGEGCPAGLFCVLSYTVFVSCLC
jgi:hypothetical protein